MKPRIRFEFIYPRLISGMKVVLLILLLGGCESIPGFSLMSDETALYRPSVVERAAMRSNRLESDSNIVRVTLEEEKKLSFFERTNSVEAPLFLSENSKVAKATPAKKIDCDDESEGFCYKLSIEGIDSGVTQVFLRFGIEDGVGDKIFLVEVK